MTFETAVTTGFGLTMGVAIGCLVILTMYSMAYVMYAMLFGKMASLLKEAGVHETIVASVAAKTEMEEKT